MTDVRTSERMLFDLSFDSKAALLEAFVCVGDQPSVTSCTLESDRLRLKYVLPRFDLRKYRASEPGMLLPQNESHDQLVIEPTHVAGIEISPVVDILHVLRNLRR